MLLRIKTAFVVLLLLLIPFVAAMQDTPPPPTPSTPPIQADRLGINHISGLDIPHDESRYTRALSLGARWNRWALYWDRVETIREQYQWDGYDQLVERDLDRGLQIDAVLLGIPALYREGETIGGLQEPIFTDGTDDPTPGKTVNPGNPWAGFVFRTVERYRPGGTLARENDWPIDKGIRVWEVWNEPDYRQFWSGGVRDYARLLKIAYIVTHALDPQATVMVGGLLYPTSDNWLAQVLGIFSRDPMHEAHNWFIDAAAVHNYADAWRSGWLTLYARQTFAAYNLSRPIWLNESGASVWDDYPGPTWIADDLPAAQTRTTMAEQAAFLVQSAAYAWAEGAQTVFFFQLYDDCGDQPAGTDFPPHDGSLCRPGQACYGDAFGIFRNPASSVCFSQHPQPETARPVAEAYRLLTRVFGGEPFSPRGVVSREFGDVVTAIHFIRPATDEKITVIWNLTTRPVSLRIPAEGSSAMLYSVERDRVIAQTGDMYALTLPPALNPMFPGGAPATTNDGQPIISANVGGMPLILTETLDARRAAEWERRTYVSP